MELMNEWAWYLFLVFVPVIILYLLRPKPKDLHIPSLMFIMEIEQRKRLRSLFKRILRDPLLLMQLLAMALIIAAVADPFYMTQETKRVNEDVVVVLDVSASMQAQGRFMQAKGIASSIISDLGRDDTVSVILAENVPIVLLRQGDKFKAQSLIESTNPKATPTGIGGAILLGSDIIKDSKVEKRIYVISDFSNYDGMNPVAAQKIAFANGISVEFMKVGSGGDNVGIISARSGRASGKCFAEGLAKNFGDYIKEVRVTLSIEGSPVDSTAKNIEAGGTEVFYISAGCAKEEQDAVLSLEADDMPADDRAYMIIPEAVDIDVLLIKERDSDDHVKYALESLEDVTVFEANPPIYPEGYAGYETIVIQDVRESNILGGTFFELRNYLEEGTNLVVMSFNDLAEIPYEEFADVLPVVPLHTASSEITPKKRFNHEILNDVDLGEIVVRKYMYADERTGSITIAEIEGMPAITFWDSGNGKVVYVGVGSNATWSDFYLKPSFPIFWHNLMYWLNRGESAGRVLNFKTGEELPLLPDTEARVTTPLGETISGSDIMLDETGYYQVEGGQRAAASLLNERESDIAYSIDPESMQFKGGYEVSSIKEDVTNEMFWTLAVAALLILAAEWFYYKGRGTLT